MCDLISRSALIDSLYSCEGLMGRRTIESVVTTINEQTAVEAKPVVHGEWIKRVKNNGGYVGSIICSVCGYSHSRVTYNFCPECGADMRKESENKCK